MLVAMSVDMMDETKAVVKVLLLVDERAVVMVVLRL